MNAVATAPPAPLAYAELERLADSIAKSGLFGIKTKDQAVALMMISHAEGRHPALAARDYDIVNGRPTKKAEAMMRDFIQAGGKVEWHALTDEIADATFTHPQTGSVRIDWDMKRALTAFGKKDMYAKFPRQMLRSRVVSEGIRTLWPLATSGMYVPEEVRDMPPAEPPAEPFNGTTLEHAADNDAKPAPRPAAAAPTPRAPRVTAKPWRSAEGEDADRWEAAERERAAARVSEATSPPPPDPDPKLEADPLTQTNQESWIIALRKMLDRAQTEDDVGEIAKHKSVGLALNNAPASVKEVISKLLHAAHKRVVKPELDGELPEVEIIGADKLAAG